MLLHLNYTCMLGVPPHLHLPVRLVGGAALRARHQRAALHSVHKHNVAGPPPAAAQGHHVPRAVGDVDAVVAGGCGAGCRRKQVGQHACTGPSFLPDRQGCTLTPHWRPWLTLDSPRDATPSPYLWRPRPAHPPAPHSCPTVWAVLCAWIQPGRPTLLAFQPSPRPPHPSCPAGRCRPGRRCPATPRCSAHGTRPYCPAGWPVRTRRTGRCRSRGCTGGSGGGKRAR